MQLKCLPLQSRDEYTEQGDGDSAKKTHKRTPWLPGEGGREVLSDSVDSKVGMALRL